MRPTVCVSLFYVIDTGSIGSRARHHVTGWGLPIYPSPLAQTLAMPTPSRPTPSLIGRSFAGSWRIQRYTSNHEASKVSCDVLTSSR